MEGGGGWVDGLHKYNLKLKEGYDWCEQSLHSNQFIVKLVSLCNMRVKMVFTVTTTAKGRKPVGKVALLPIIKKGNYSGIGCGRETQCGIMACAVHR